MGNHFSSESVKLKSLQHKTLLRKIDPRFKYKISSAFFHSQNERSKVSLILWMYQGPHLIPKVLQTGYFWVPSFFLHYCLTVCGWTDMPSYEEKIIHLLISALRRQCSYQLWFPEHTLSSESQNCRISLVGKDLWDRRVQPLSDLHFVN